jgi:hypothetical protein
MSNAIRRKALPDFTLQSPILESESGEDQADRRDSGFGFSGNGIE